MFLYKFKIKISFLSATLIILSGCGLSGNKVAELYDDALSDEYEYEIACPTVKYISSMDKIKPTKENNYEASFYEVKWKCYSYSKNEKVFIEKNIDLAIKYQIDYKDSNDAFKEEKFSLILALLNNKDEIIVKNKFNRFFLNNTNSQIINDTNGIISIKLEEEHKDFSEYILLLGIMR
jgi:hypothetical protein